MSTLKDVAERAQVSITTASHTLNRTRRVDPETARRVLSAAKELGYTAIHSQGNWRSAGSRTIGVVAPSALDAFFAEVVAGIESACYTRNYEVYLGFSEHPGVNADDYTEAFSRRERQFVETVLTGDCEYHMPMDWRDRMGFDKELSIINKLLARKIDGFILNPTQTDEVLAATLAPAHTKVTLFHRTIPGLDVDVYLSDDYGVTTRILQRLLSLGHRRIAMVYGFSWHNHPVRHRFRAYRDVLLAAGIALDPALLALGYYTLEGAAHATNSLLSLPNRPTAIIYWSDAMAVSGIDAARSAGIKVPEDLSVIGFDDMPISSRLSPKLSSVRQNQFMVGVTMANRLIARIEGQLTEPPGRMISPLEFIERESVGRVPPQ